MSPTCLLGWVGDKCVDLEDCCSRVCRNRKCGGNGRVRPNRPRNKRRMKDKKPQKTMSPRPSLRPSSHPSASAVPSTSIYPSSIPSVSVSPSYSFSPTAPTVGPTTLACFDLNKKGCKTDVDCCYSATCNDIQCFRGVCVDCWISGLNCKRDKDCCSGWWCEKDYRGRLYYTSLCKLDKRKKGMKKKRPHKA
jgi:hypothetical protein